MSTPDGRLIRRNLKISRLQPGTPRNLHFENGLLSWVGPQGGGPYTHFRIRVDRDLGAPDFEVSAGQASAAITSGSRFFITTYNQVNGLESPQASIGAGSGASGSENAPSVVNLAYALEYQAKDGGANQWRYTLTWTEPTTDQLFPLVKGYAIYLESGGKRTRVIEVPKGKTSYVSSWKQVPSGVEAYQVWVPTVSTLNKENSIAAGTPTVSFNVSFQAGAGGSEYTSNVTLIAATVAYPGATADGSYPAKISATFTPPADATWGSVDMVAWDGANYNTLARSVRTSPATATVPTPDTLATWTIYMVSRDAAGRINSITAGTPHQDVAIGSASGELNGAKLRVSTVSTVSLDATGISVGGGGGKPGTLGVYNAAGSQIGWIGSSGGNDGGWYKTLSVGGTSYAGGKLKADASGNLSITDATISVTAGNDAIGINATDGMKFTNAVASAVTQLLNGQLGISDIAAYGGHDGSTTSKYGLQADHYQNGGGGGTQYSGFYTPNGPIVKVDGIEYIALKGAPLTPGLYISGNQVVGSRKAAVTAPAGGGTIDAEARTAINDIISRLQAHGLIS